ncbi:hypothetical protein QJS67_04755 [Acinetobacter radioresistens]|nr:hypothetical protein QJS67_04755 [Acinetobacter radioresistens]
MIPSSRLVYLLIQLDRIEEAKSFIEVMIEVLKEETRNLNLQTPSWNWNENLDEHEIAIALLVTRLQWPFTSIKQWTASELSTLLTVNDTQKIVEARLLESLKSKKLESEVVEILCVFWMACQKGYHPTIVLGEYVFSRSCLSDQLLNAIDSKNCNYGYYQGNFDIDSGLIERESNFRKNLGSEFPLMYLSTCEDLEEKYFIPLTEDFQHEWNKTFIHEPRLHDTYQYFLERDNTGQFYTLNSHRARSAYLRVFEVAKLRYGMPDEYANFYSIKALPLETAYLNFLPSRVMWFTKWNSQDEYSIESLKDYLRKLIRVCNTSNEGKILGALSFPLKISSKLQLDITCTLRNDKSKASDRSQIASIGLDLEKKLEFQFIRSRSQSTASDGFPFIGTAYPRHRYGHWSVEQDSRGIYVPIIPDTEFKIIGCSDNKLIRYLLDNMEVGVSGYWNEEWNRTYPSKIKPKCATYTLLYPQYFQYIGNTETEFKYVCKVNIASKERDYSDFQFEELTIEI